MNCPAKNDKVNAQLCELFYPYGCGVKCKNLYKRWIETEDEVRKLEAETKEEKVTP